MKEKKRSGESKEYRGKEGKVLSVEKRERERKKRPSRERTHNSVKNWKVAMPYPPGQCPDKYFRRKKA